MGISLCIAAAVTLVLAVFFEWGISCDYAAYLRRRDAQHVLLMHIDDIAAWSDAIGRELAEYGTSATLESVRPEPSDALVIPRSWSDLLTWEPFWMLQPEPCLVGEERKFG